MSFYKRAKKKIWVTSIKAICIVKIKDQIHLIIIVCIVLVQFIGSGLPDGQMNSVQSENSVSEMYSMPETM